VLEEVAEERDDEGAGPERPEDLGRDVDPPTESEVTSSPVKYGSARTDSPQARSATSRTRIETPMVMMIIRRTEGFRSQRMQVTSTSAPAAIVTRTAPAMASGSGRRRWSVTAVIPPSITNSPWAKLMMPVVL
jgi:hypothetical protein